MTIHKTMCSYRLDNELMKRVRKDAATEGESVTGYIETALRMYQAQKAGLHEPCQQLITMRAALDKINLF